MATAGINLVRRHEMDNVTMTTGTDELEDYLNELIDGPTLEQWHRELLMDERERAYREEMREAQIAKVDAYIDDFPF